MNLWQRLWRDIREEEKIEVYLMILAALILVVLDLAGVTSDFLPPLNVAILALLVFATLGNRQRLDRALQRIRQSSENVLLDEFPPDLPAKIEGADQLWLVGINLDTTIRDYYHVYERLLRDGSTVRVLMLPPEGDFYESATATCYPELTPGRNRDLILATLEMLCRLQEDTGGRLEIRTLDYLLPFGAFMIDPEQATGVIYLKYYCYKMSAYFTFNKMSRRELPKLALTQQDGQWWDFYQTQIRVMWENGTPWEC